MRRRRALLVIGLALACFEAQAVAGERPVIRPPAFAGEPMGYRSRDWRFAAEIFPPHSRRNAGDRPLCYVYNVGDPAVDWTVRPRLLWKAPLLRMPYEAFVSPRGDLVALDEFGGRPFNASGDDVVVYRRDGGRVAYALTELLPAREIEVHEAAARRSEKGAQGIDMSPWWTRSARYFFAVEPTRFYVMFAWGSALELMVDSGTFRHSTNWDDFRPLRGATSMRGAEAKEAAAGPMSLRFSSITDLLAIGTRNGAGSEPGRP